MKDTDKSEPASRRSSVMLDGRPDFDRPPPEGKPPRYGKPPHDGMPPCDGKPPREGCPPEFRAPLMLANEISKLFSNILRTEEDNVTNSYRLLLIHLAHRDGRTQLELANLAHIKPPTVSVTLQKMERDGYVRREADENDLRQTRVYLTEKGREYDERIKSKIHELEDGVLSVLSEEELSTLMTLMTRVRDSLYKSAGFDDGFDRRHE